MQFLPQLRMTFSKELTTIGKNRAPTSRSAHPITLGSPVRGLAKSSVLTSTLLAQFTFIQPFTPLPEAADALITFRTLLLPVLVAPLAILISLCGITPLRSLLGRPRGSVPFIFILYKFT